MNKTYAVADLHGRYDIYKKIREFMDDSDILYVLGDCCDRGPDGWKLIKAVYYDTKSFYIKGNHEEMLISAMEGDDLLNYINGGISTLTSWRDEGEDMQWVTRLSTLPDEIIYLNKNNKAIILCHSGYTPYKTRPNNFYERIWNRKHFMNKWDEETYPDIIIVHGHTPIPLMDKYLPITPIEDKALWYCNNHKVNIDNGACWTNKAILLDLDTFEEHIIEVT